MLTGKETAGLAWRLKQEGKTQNEIAEMLGESQSTISTAISRERNRRMGESPEPSRPGDETRGMSQTPVPDGAYDPVIPADPRSGGKQRGRIVNLMREAYRQGVAQAMSQFGIET